MDDISPTSAGTLSFDFEFVEARQGIGESGEELELQEETQVSPSAELKSQFRVVADTAARLARIGIANVLMPTTTRATAMSSSNAPTSSMTSPEKK
jgi:hypothetical protein